MGQQPRVAEAQEIKLLTNVGTTSVEISSTAPVSKRKSSILSIAVTALVVPGLFATVALPAYAYSPPEPDNSGPPAALQQLLNRDAQTIVVSAAADVSSVARDAFGATSAAEIEAASYPAYSGPSAADFLKNPPYPSFSLDQVAQVALQYQGVPYRYGGADPSGFDCSGFVMFVYSQFGISLPHSVTGSAAVGTLISEADARPGDMVVTDGGGHSGIYLGNGTFIDAPYEGQVVVVRTIYTSSRYFVRFGI
jgi:cell wall-associated NlpC family hydrolase